MPKILAFIKFQLEKILAISLIVLFSFSGYSQYLQIDKIGLTNGVSLEGELIEIHKPKYLIIKTEEFGEVKVLYPDVKYILQKPDPNDRFYKLGAHQYFSAGIGYGSEYAGIGVRLQLRAGRKTGFACFVAFGSKDVERYDIPYSFYNNDGTYTSYYEERGTYNAFNSSIGIKFYPYTYFYIGGGLQVKIDSYPDFDHFTMIGIDFPVHKNVLLNSSIGYQSTNAFVSHTGNLMINLGIHFKLTTFPVKANQVNKK